MGIGMTSLGFVDNSTPYDEEEYPEVGRDYECDLCLEHKVLGRLCTDCFHKVLHNHLNAFVKSGVKTEDYINSLIRNRDIKEVGK